MSNVSDDYLKKIFKIIYKFAKSEFPRIEVSWLFDDASVYEDIFMFIQDKLSHSDSEEVDFIYASFSLNWEMYGSSFPEIYGEVVRPKLTMYEGRKTYGADVVYNEFYHHRTYLPVMLEYMINEFQIDEDHVDTDIRDTWDHEISVEKKIK
jgi:hypothetical protein